MNKADFRSTPPSAGPMPSISIGKFDTIVLENGLTIIVVENRKLPKVAFQLIVNHDPVVEGENAGLSEIAGELLGRGTQTKSKADIDDLIDYYGANFQTNSSGIFGSVLTKYQAEFLSVFSDVLLNPSFPESEFKKIKLRHASRLQTIRNEPSEIAFNICTMANFGKSHPYGDILTQDSLNKITVSDCKAYHNAYWKPSCSYLAIIGDTSIREVQDRIVPILNKWQNNSVPSHEHDKVTAPNKNRICFFDRPGAIQSELRITYPMDLHPANPDRIPATVMNHMLGGGAFSGYLMSNLREDKAYTYGVRSIMQLDPLAAEFKVTTSVGTDVTINAVKEIFLEMNRIRTEQVDEDHLELAKNSMIGSFARSIENPQTLANRVLNVMRYELPDKFYETFAEKLEAVSAEDIRSMAMKYIDTTQCHIVIVGDYAAMKSQIENEFLHVDVIMHDPFGNIIN